MALAKKTRYGQGKYGYNLYEMPFHPIDQLIDNRLDEDLQYFRDKIDKALEIK